MSRTSSPTLNSAGVFSYPNAPGGSGIIDISRSKVSDPPPLEAVMAYDPEVRLVGVPSIAPVSFTSRPSGKGGSEDHVMGRCPITMGTSPSQRLSRKQIRGAF